MRTKTNFTWPMTGPARSASWMLALGAVALAAVLAWPVVGGALAQSDEGDKILGRWLTQDEDAIVEITRERNEYVGNIVWLEEPYDDDGNPILDAENPEPELRDRPVLGLRILHGFEWDGRRWSGGRVYDPENGKEYRGRLSLDDDDTLRLRGFVGIAAFGRTEIWTRHKE